MEIPKEVLMLNPRFTSAQIREVFNTLLKSKSTRLKSAQVFDFKIPGIGRFSSHGNKKVKGYNKAKARDRKRKRLQLREIKMSKESVLW